MFCWLVGGGGRANGFGGPPVAPADSSAEAEGDGGGSTSPLCARSVGLAERSPIARFGEPEPDSLSSASDGMVKLSFGRLEMDPDFDPPVLLLVGGVNSGVADVVVVARTGCAGRARESCEDCDGCDMARGGGLRSARSSFLGGSGAPKKCLARTDPPSSMGVKMLCDFVCLR